jgi:acyl carrier protein
MDEVLAEIRRIAREELAVEREVLPENDLVTDLMIDSVGLLTLVVGLENRFRIALAEEDAAGVRTVGDLAALVLSRRTGTQAC